MKMDVIKFENYNEMLFKSQKSTEICWISQEGFKRPTKHFSYILRRPRGMTSVSTLH